MKTIKNVTTQQFRNAITQINPDAIFLDDHPNHVVFHENIQIEMRRGNMACCYQAPKPVYEQVKTLLENSNFTFRSNQPNGYCVIEYDTDNHLERVVELYNLIANADIDFNLTSGSRRSVLNKDGVFARMARQIKFSYDEESTKWLHRVIFDSVDEIISLNEKTDTNNYREHLVPCTMLFDEAIRMFDEDDASVNDVAVMLQRNLFILHIPAEIANKMDTTLGLKTSMPSDWQFGDCVFARLTAAGYNHNA